MCTTRLQARTHNLFVPDEPLMFNGHKGHTHGMLHPFVSNRISNDINTKMDRDIQMVAPFFARGLPNPVNAKPYPIVKMYFKFLLQFVRTQNIVWGKMRLQRRGVNINSDLLYRHRKIKRSLKTYLNAFDWFDVEHRRHLKEDRDVYESQVNCDDEHKCQLGQRIVNKNWCFNCNTVDMLQEGYDDSDSTTTHVSETSVENVMFDPITSNQMDNPMCSAMYFDMPPLE